MKDNWFKNNWLYLLLLFAVISAIMALNTSDFFYKSGSAGVGILIILIINFRKTKQPNDTWMIIGAFIFSIVGDWFMSNKLGDTMMFSKGIALFFIAHLGYLGFALVNGKIKWRFTLIILIAYLLFFFLLLSPSIDDKILRYAGLIYLLISCLTFGSSMGIKGDTVFKWAYIFGIFLIVFSDTIIALTEFLGYTELDFIILPTYYLAHISITYSLIRRENL
ncbi:lysoplasmalogenase [uncultured Eudoraea sp.]|uniref:lysoplasmalogenase n=1 Tax=uncultured Eudoraea sp. TaxID=1035614 RepID=UPI00262AA209|nr:lysoplasmalogenase [uncultured Eudoraea sp.]